MGKKFIRFSSLFVSICVLASTGLSNSNNDENNEPSSKSHAEPVEYTNQGTEFFDGSLKDALAQAEREDKDVFVFYYAPWTPLWVIMKEAVFPDPDVGKFLNQRFVSFEFDLGNIDLHKGEFESVADDDEGIDLVEPTYFIMDNKGNSIGHAHGRASPDQLISIVSRLLGETDSMFGDLQTRYESGERSSKFIQQYLTAAIEELSFRQLNSDDEASVNAYEAEGEKYKQIADEYFQSKPDAELINETDAHLIMYFCEPPMRGDRLVEFVLRHYDEFLAVSSETAMSQFTLHATTNACKVTAEAGDEKFMEYVEALETYPLKQAVDYERTRRPQSDHLPEFINLKWGLDYHKERGAWDRVYEILIERLEALGETAREWDYMQVARELVQSDNQAHLETAVKYGRNLHESKPKNPNYAAVYVAALQVSGKKYTAVQVSEQYRKKMSRLSYDKEQLKTYDHELSVLLEKIKEAATSDE
ncbi:MAG: hypothetical protein F4Z01_07825 [Gammaproteobacteria bacterium]|nr:hypothetical protein [Gammaproteobacteria bacterium]MYF38672.1 hypothetical protein [Gammaproteobacteria bacterium]